MEYLFPSSHFQSPWVSSSEVGLFSVQFSHSVISDSLRPHDLQHTRPPCPSPTPGVHTNSCPSSQWCHQAISSSVARFSSCSQCFPGSFPVNQLFTSGGQSIRASASATVLPMNIQGWSPLRWIGLISLQSKDSQESSPAPQLESINSSSLSLLYGPDLMDPLSMKFSKQEYWSGLLFPFPGFLTDPGIAWVSHNADIFFTFWATREFHCTP